MVNSYCVKLESLNEIWVIYGESKTLIKVRSELTKHQMSILSAASPVSPIMVDLILMEWNSASFNAQILFVEQTFSNCNRFPTIRNFKSMNQNV